MTVMGAARDAAWAKAEPFLNAMAAKVYRLGDRAGNGSKVKIINQLLAGVHIAAAAEAMALGLREGVDAAALYDVITHSAGNSWMFENRMAHVLANDYTPLSAVDIFVKDLGLVLDTARATKFPLPLASTAHQMFMQASTAGFAKEDDAAVIKIFPGHRAARREEDDDAVRLGCIADDFTGATDLANNLVRAGMRVVQTIGVPGPARRRSSRRRRRRRRAQVAHDRAAPTRSRSRSPRCRWLQRRRRDADLLQGLLDLRLDAARQHRPGARGADGRARLPLHDRDAGLSRQRRAPSSRATCSSATCCSPRAACATIR